MNKKAASNLKNRCISCLMPDHAVSVKDGSCNFCSPGSDSHYDATIISMNDNSKYTMEQIREMVAKDKGRYDCIMGISGGRDSTFLLYYVKEVLGFYPLAVNFDNGFVSEDAWANMRNVTTALGVDFVSYKLDWNFYRKLLRMFFLTRGEFCSPCRHGCEYVLPKIAKDNGVKITFRGISTSMDLNPIDEDFYDECMSGNEFYEHVSRFGKEYGITEDEMTRHHDFLDKRTWPEDVILIDLPDFIGYDFKEIQDTIEKKFNWRHPAGQFFHSDCTINPLVDYLYVHRFGYSEKQVFVSNLLKNKKIDVQKGMELMEQELLNENPEPLVAQMLEVLDVDRETYDKIIKEHHEKH